MDVGFGFMIPDRQKFQFFSIVLFFSYFLLLKINMIKYFGIWNSFNLVFTPLNNNNDNT